MTTKTQPATNERETREETEPVITWQSLSDKLRKATDAITQDKEGAELRARSRRQLAIWKIRKNDETPQRRIQRLSQQKKKHIYQKTNQCLGESRHAQNGAEYG